MGSSERSSEKVLLNGDVYIGNFKGVFPHGKGKYTWPDGTVYEGDWEAGKMTGKGKIFWSSGATYEGDFSGDYLHGFGTLISPDGSSYKGAWRMNIQHGLGRKEYCNSDVYDGSWKEGIREGSGQYAWSNGSTYIGNWKAGIINGRGVMTWVNGDLFDGFWLNGLRHGSGCYRFADGSYYFGTWTKGLKDGQGTYYPAGSKLPSLRRLSSFGGHEGKRHEGKKKRLLFHSSSLNSKESRVVGSTVKRSLSEKISTKRFPGGPGQISQRTISLDEVSSLYDSTREFSSHDTSCVSSLSSNRGQYDVQDDTSIFFEREYMQGVLIKERVRKRTELLRKNKQQSKFHSNKVKRRSCVDIFEGRKSHYLMLNLQLGIRYTVGKITPVPMRDVRASDFGERAKIQMYFPRKGSQFTPPHYSTDFYWKDYCPMVFRNLRDMFKLDAAEYMMSICGDGSLREVSSPGKSGSIFYISHDDRFFIKTLRRSELKVHFVVTGNMFYTELRIHRRFDLKGSTQGRITNQDDKIDESTTLKDGDLEYEFQMDKLLRESLFEQLNVDCTFLESQQIIDYSLLLGLHFRAPDQLSAPLEPPDALHKHETLPGDDGAILPEISIPPRGLLLVIHEPNCVSTAPGTHTRGNTLRALSVGDKEVDLILPGTVRLRVQLGANMPALAHRKLKQDGTDSEEVELFEVYDVVLYLGIIDILQKYNMKKKLEHAYKSLLYNPMTISCVEPKLYSRRFISFLERVFPAPEQP
ncbi:phosphatidylinositol 4-phosphate 5-kinase 8-like isoform X2 [Diospyros lotus]|uniref:phosphatidylinositol 4-phosphate 5-kinase 8-like isoform X2 n=1 Tax=Diospyros lotus TaxID=55363 RepID=UPI00224E6969|nr:phosphatidylinositol 4-phosphate 5-kinase 8-like isoform X2 [Diospyros lotus]